MPKRPFSELECEDSRLQSKIHVGPKEVNLGICASSNMKAVYQRTLSLLFQGSKNKVNQEVITPAPVALGPVQPKYSQMVITPNGQISNQSKEKSEQIINSKPLSAVCQCPSCMTANCVMYDRCRFCEQFVCESCFKVCAVCTGEFCNKCSMKIYSRDEHIVCFSCATKKKHL